MRGQIAAVNRRDISRQQGFQVFSVVPVEKMTLVALERGHRLQGIAGAIEQCARSYIAKVPGIQIGKQRKAHVGR